MKSAGIFFLLLAACFGQNDPQSADEERELSMALAEAGSSPIEFIRALEKHLAQHPDSPRRPEMERALVKAAIENKDERRIILYGERVLARESEDLQVLDRVTRALLSSEARDPAERALKYARRYEELVGEMRKQSPPGRVSAGQWQEDLDRGASRALVMQARATGNLGRMEEAVALARKASEAFPGSEPAREIARWLSRSGKDEEALPYLADAFSISDPRNTEADRIKDRARLGELYRKLRGSEKGLGDVVLEAYDRTTALLAQRKLRLQAADPNAQLTRITDFTLSGLRGEKLRLATLKGKTIVFDFWATWCGPCRAQHPLYEEVKQRFRDSDDVMFLSVNTDEDRELVEPFVKANKWDQTIYFEDGLARTLQIASIPTTIIVDKRGEVFSRLNGYVPHRFVDMLAERIREARKE